MRKVLFGLGILASLFILIDSLLPMKPAPLVQSISPSGFLFHLAAYAVLAALFIESEDKKDIAFYVLVFIAITAYGILIEILQGFTQTRTPSFFDALANSIGIALSMAVTTFINKNSAS